MQVLVLLLLATNEHSPQLKNITEIYNSPFEITETGWGEFEAGIRIFFRDPEEQPIDIPHTIKLYQGPSGVPHLPSKQPVMSEFYDEIVFTDPSPDFASQLMGYTPPSARKITDMTEHYSIFSDQEDLRQLTLIQDHIRSELEASKIRLLTLESELATSAHAASSVPYSLGVSALAASVAPVPASVGPSRKRNSNAAGAAAAAQGKGSRPPVSATDRRRAANKSLPPNPKKGAAVAKAVAAAAAAVVALDDEEAGLMGSNGGGAAEVPADA